MKDFVITAKRKKTEITIATLCFLLAYVANVYSIIAYHTPWIELFTSLGYVTVAACILYAAFGVLRILFYAVAFVVKRRK